VDRDVRPVHATRTDLCLSSVMSLTDNVNADQIAEVEIAVDVLIITGETPALSVYRANVIRVVQDPSNVIVTRASVSVNRE